MVSLAERVLRARRDGETGNGRIEVTHHKDPRGIGPSMDLIKVAYAIPGRHRTTFNLLPPSYYLFPNNLERLIEKGGGYDKITKRVR